MSSNNTDLVSFAPLEWFLREKNCKDDSYNVQTLIYALNTAGLNMETLQEDYIDGKDISQISLLLPFAIFGPRW